MKTQTEAQHAPTPWKAERTTVATQALLKMNGMAGDPSDIELWDANGDCIGVVKDLKTGRKIVRAVNAHKALLARLNVLIATLESVRANYDKPEKALNGSWYSFDHMISDEISRTRKAIAQASGQQSV